MNLKNISWRETFLSPMGFVLILGLVSGMTFVFVTPPFQAADEHMHFVRVYNVSEGHLLATCTNNRVGAYLPASLISSRFSPFWQMPHDHGLRMSSSIFTQALSVRLNPDNRSFIDFVNTGGSSPFCYLPQSMACFFLRLLNTPPILILYAERVANLFGWLALVVLAIHVAPTGKWTIAMIAMSPVALFQASSASADMMTNGVALLLTAYGLNLAMQRPSPVSLRQITVFIILSVILAMCKFVYVPLVALFLLIPSNRFASPRVKWQAYLAVFGCAGLAWLVWTMYAKGIYLTYDEYDPIARMGQALIPGVNPHMQFLHILHAPFSFCRMLWTTVISQYGWMTSMLWFGWDMVLPRPVAVVYSIILFGLCFVHPAPTPYGLLRRLMLLVLVIASAGMLGIVLYSYWTPVGASSLSCFHGRYILPVGFAALAVLHVGCRRKIQHLWIPCACVACWAHWHVVHTLLLRYY